MANLIRTDFSGALHHVYGRGNNKQTIFWDDADRSSFLRKLEALKKENALKIYALCLMSNHYHMLIETVTPLAKTMGRLLTSYSGRFARKYGTVGHLFQGRYRAKLCGRDAYFLRLIRYIHRNPVAAGMVAEPGDWKWSGHRQLAFGESGLLDATFPMAFFGTDDIRARAAYRSFCADPIDDHCSDFDDAPDELLPSVPLETIAAEVAREHRIDLIRLVGGQRGKDLTMAKLALVQRARLQGISQSDVARMLRCSEAAVSQLLSRGVKLRS
jgi:putative transposase